MPIQGPIPFPLRKTRKKSVRRIWPILAASALLLGLIAAILTAAFRWGMLVEDTPGAHARWSLVLAGEGGGDADRTAMALQLVRDHRTDTIILSGTPLLEDVWMSSLLAARLPQGPEEKRRIVEIHHNSHSTLEEARTLIPQLRSLGIDTLLLVTSNFHTRRAASIFRQVANGNPVILPVASNCKSFQNGWGDREGAKIWLNEWSKTLWWHLVERWSDKSPIPNATNTLRYPETGKLGSLAPNCPACPATTPCPQAPACPQVKAEKTEHKIDKPKEKAKAPKSEKASKEIKSGKRRN